MKKILFLLLISLTLVTNVKGSGVSQTIVKQTGTNINGIIQGLSTKVTAFTLTSTPGTAAVLTFYDAPVFTSNGTNGVLLNITNSAYAYYTKYATNFVTSYTNYYGVVTSYTNLSLATASNWMAAGSSAIPPKITIVGITNGSINIDDANFYFTAGMWVTNTGTGDGNIIMNVVQ